MYMQRPHWTVSVRYTCNTTTNPYCELDCIVARASLIYADYLCGKYKCGEPIDNDSRQSSLAWGGPLNSMLSPLPQSTMLTITCHVYSNCFRNPARPGGTIHGNFLPPGCSRRVGRVQVSGDFLRSEFTNSSFKNSQRGNTLGIYRVRPIRRNKHDGERGGCSLWNLRAINSGVPSPPPVWYGPLPPGQPRSQKPWDPDARSFRTREFSGIQHSRVSYANDAEAFRFESNR